MNAIDNLLPGDPKTARQELAWERRNRCRLAIRRLLAIHEMTTAELQDSLGDFSRSMVAESVSLLHSEGIILTVGREASTSRGPGRRIFSPAVEIVAPKPKPEPVDHESQARAVRDLEVGRQRDRLYWSIYGCPGLTLPEYADRLRTPPAPRLTSAWMPRLAELVEQGRVRVDGDRIFVGVGR